MRAGLGVRVEQNGFRISRTHFLRPTEQRDEHLECLDDGTSRFSFSFIMPPADEVDDGFVLQFGIRGTRASSFIRQLHDLIFVRQLLARLTPAIGRVGVTDANGYNIKQRRLFQIGKNTSKS